MNDRKQNPQAADQVTAAFPMDAARPQGTADTSVDLDQTLPTGAPAAPAPDPQRIGRYTVVQCLGKGGQGAVYRAIHPSLPIELAIKVSTHKLDASAHQALQEEAQILCELEHPHIARVRDLDFDQGLPFLVLDFIRGRSLDELLASGEPSREQLVQWLATVATAIDYAHRRGILHLDLKPGNIVIDEKDVAKVIDFGMARMRGAWSDSSLETDGISGTLSYMSPEQASGRAQKIGSRSDIFALGAILYRILTGQPPFRGSTVSETLASVRECRFDAQRLDAVDAPRHWIDACCKAMESDPAKRFGSAKEFAEAIAPVAAAALPSARRQTSLSFSFLGITITLAVSCVLLFVFAIDRLAPRDSVAMMDQPPNAAADSSPAAAPLTIPSPAPANLNLQFDPPAPESRASLPADVQLRTKLPLESAMPPLTQPSQEHLALRGLLRQTIATESARTSLQADLKQFLRSPEAKSWERIRTRATTDRETLKGVILGLDELESPFVVDEMATYRQLRLDLGEKQRLYDRLIDMDAEAATQNLEAVQQIADQYTQLIERIRQYEATMQQFLQTSK